MKLRNFILQLPGFDSYCHCERLCSKIEIEHVVPKKILKERASKHQISEACRDPHNLYKCCSILNRKKGCLLLGENYSGEDFNGMLARSCLYMNFTYDLRFETHLLRKWENFSLLYPPFEFEYERSLLIESKTGKINPFIKKEFH